MQEKSYTRITLALDIISKISTGPFKGYHELGIIKHKIDLFDLIKIEKSDTLSIECDNPLVPGDARNICWQAVELIKNTYNISENVHISIKKNIPVMGGLAGGSANAATVLKMCNELWNINANKEELAALGKKLGMDVPFYFYGSTAFDSEAGGTIFSIDNTMVFKFIIVTSQPGVSTKSAYKNIDYSNIALLQHTTQAMIEGFKSQDRECVLQSLHNDFELSVFFQYPHLKKIKETLSNEGCPAVLSGSGATVIGIIDQEDQFERISRKLKQFSFITGVMLCNSRL